jgi:hypothetical protein
MLLCALLRMHQPLRLLLQLLLLPLLLLLLLSTSS